MQIKEIRVGGIIEEGGQERMIVTIVASTGVYRVTGQGRGDSYHECYLAALANMKERLPPTRTAAIEFVDQLIDEALLARK